jgi:hypothetical protein
MQYFFVVEDFIDAEVIDLMDDGPEQSVSNLRTAIGAYDVLMPPADFKCSGFPPTNVALDVASTKKIYGLIESAKGFLKPGKD